MLNFCLLALSFRSQKSDADSVAAARPSFPAGYRFRGHPFQESKHTKCLSREPRAGLLSSKMGHHHHHFLMRCAAEPCQRWWFHDISRLCLEFIWSCSLFAVWSVGHVRCMGSSDRAFVIQIVAMMVGNTTPTGIRHSEMGLGCIQGTGPRSGQKPAAWCCILPVKFGRLP